MARGWGALLAGLAGRGPAPDAGPDPFAAVGQPPVARGEDPLSLGLDEVERAALAVYARHGLPTRPGDYRRGPRAARWTWLGERLTPDQRWALALDRPPEKGWRYGRLEALGAHEAAPELRQASRLLTACARLRLRVARGASSDLIDDLVAAVALGEDWRALREAEARATAPKLVLKPVRPGR